MLDTRNFEQARALIEEKDDYFVQLLAEAFISSRKPAEAMTLIESKGCVQRRLRPIRLRDNCYLARSWGRSLARLAVCFAQRQEYAQCNRIIDALRASIDAYGNRFERPPMLADLGWALAAIRREGEAAIVFQHAEESLNIRVDSLERRWYSYLLEALVSSGFVPRAVALSEQILGVVNSADDSQNGILQDCAIACGKGGLFELGQKFIDQMRGSYWQRVTFIELSREAIRKREVTAAVKLAFAWPGWMESQHWAEMLPQLADALVDEQRFGDLRTLIPLAKESRLRYCLLAKLAAGLARTRHLADAFEAIERTDVEHVMIFLAESSVTYEEIERSLSFRVLQNATRVAGWTRADWGKIHELLADPVSVRLETEKSALSVS
jgi:hypothetical protein